MTKKDFIKKIIDIEHPIMIFGSDHKMELLNSWCIVRDEKDRSKSFNAYFCRLSHREYFNGKVNTYIKREDAMRKKFEKWLYDVCGNYCTVKNSTL